MKTTAIVMVVVLILSIIGVGYLYMTANLSVEGIGVSATEATAQSDTFSALKRQMQNGTLIGTPFSSAPLGDASNYQFLTFTLRLNNRCFIPADMIEIQITPMEGDVLQMGELTPKLLPGRSVGELSTTILTDINMHSVREVTITYYMWGMAFSTKTTSYNR